MKYSIVNYNEVKLHSELRLEAEYYSPEFIDLKNNLSQLNVGLLKDYVQEIKCGPFGSTILCETYDSDGVIVARPFNIKNCFFNLSDLAYISDEDCKAKGLKIYQSGDILFSRVGDIRCGIIPETNNKITISPNIIAIKPISEKLNPYYLTIFFNIKYGYLQLLRNIKVVAQPTIPTEILYNLNVVLFNNEFQKIIEKLFKYSLDEYSQSGILYTSSENLLLKELNIENWTTKHKLWSIKNYSDVKNANRLDAEYFQPKYDEIIEKIKNYSNGYDKLKNMVQIKDFNFIPKSKEEYKYIELANIAKSGEINNCTVDFGCNLPTRARRIVSTGDVIVSSIEGSLDSVALITSENNSSLCSTGFYVINSSSLNSETLFCLMKSEFIQMQLKRGCSGTILTAINKDEFENITLPKINNNVQIQIKDNIQEMYKLKQQSKQLLEIAKRGVEIAIEQDEDIATSWINQELQKIGVEL